MHVAPFLHGLNSLLQKGIFRSQYSPVGCGKALSFVFLGCGSSECGGVRIKILRTQGVWILAYVTVLIYYMNLSNLNPLLGRKERLQKEGRKERRNSGGNVDGNGKKWQGKEEYK